MKVTQMPPVHAVNLVTNSGNTAYGVDVTTFSIFFPIYGIACALLTYSSLDDQNDIFINHLVFTINWEVSAFPIAVLVAVCLRSLHH